MDPSIPEPKPNSLPGAPVALSRPTRGVVSLMGETLPILGRAFVIIYTFFFYFMLLGLLLPQSKPDFSQWAWWAVALGLIAIWLVLGGGWNAMMATAVREWDIRRGYISANPDRDGDMLPPDAETSPITTPWRLMRRFLPGIGDYGVSYLFGGLIWLSLLALPALAVIAYSNTIKSLPGLIKLGMAQADYHRVYLYFHSLSESEQAALMTWELSIVGAIALTSLLYALTLYWQPMLVQRDINPLKALWESTVHALRHPLATTLLLLVFAMLIILTLLLTLASPVTAFLGAIFMVPSLLYCGLLVHLYIQRSDAA